jgi:hypothetical protein
LSEGIEENYEKTQSANLGFPPKLEPGTSLIQVGTVTAKPKFLGFNTSIFDPSPDPK